MKKINKSRERLINLDKKDAPPLFYRHLFAYNYVMPLIKGKTVFEVGCSDGYGSFLLAKHAKKITALDLDKQIIDYAKNKYKRKNLSFIYGDILNLPVKEKYDVIISFQVIEHIKPVDVYLGQISKALKPKGIFIVTTPNRKIRLRDGQKPWNRFHVQEYEHRQLRNLLSKYFSDVEIKGLTAIPDIYSLEKRRLAIRSLIAKIDPLNIYEYVPRNFTDKILKSLRMILNKEKKGLKVGLDNFFITKQNLEKVLDLIAICRK